MSISFSFCASMFQFHLCCDPQLPFSIYPTLLTSANAKPGEQPLSCRRDDVGGGGGPGR